MGCGTSSKFITGADEPEPQPPQKAPGQRPGAPAAAAAVQVTKVAFEELKTHGQLRLEVTHGLVAHDFADLWREKHLAHLTGTREWAFADILAWLDTSDAAQLSWLMGGGGVGKSVLTAELLRRTFSGVVAWHFCRHDNPQQSSPAALLRSLAAMLCARLPGYKEALGKVSAELLTSTDPKELFAALFTEPLQKVKRLGTPRLIIIDALDELPKQGQKSLLDVIATQLSTLPTWLRLFVTSREEPQIKRALAKFEPKELRADEAKNRADVEVRHTHTTHYTHKQEGVYGRQYMYMYMSVWQHTVCCLDVCLHYLDCAASIIRSCWYVAVGWRIPTAHLTRPSPLSAPYVRHLTIVLCRDTTISLTTRVSYSEDNTYYAACPQRVGLPLHSAVEDLTKYTHSTCYACYTN